jgi:hypothetical protein
MATSGVQLPDGKLAGMAAVGLAAAAAVGYYVGRSAGARAGAHAAPLPPPPPATRKGGPRKPTFSKDCKSAAEVK